MPLPRGTTIAALLISLSAIVLCLSSLICLFWIAYASHAVSAMCNWWSGLLVLLLVLIFVGPVMTLIFAVYLARSGQPSASWKTIFQAGSIGFVALDDREKGTPTTVPNYNATSNQAPSPAPQTNTSCLKKIKGATVIGVIGFTLACCVLVAVAVLTAGMASLVSGNGIPNEVSGLVDDVDIDYDDNGIPHIYAKNLHDAFFTMGLVHARDRLWQMEFQRRYGAGKLSEVIGDSALDVDKDMRNLCLYRAAQRDYDILNSTTQQIVLDYIDGINAYLASNPNLPAEFRILGFEPANWEPADVFVWNKVMSLTLSNDRSETFKRWSFLIDQGLSYDRIMQLLPPYNRSSAVTVLTLEDLQSAGVAVGEVCPARETDPQELIDYLNGLRSQTSNTQTHKKKKNAAYQLPRANHGASNNWIISANLTQDKQGPLLCNDPHLRLSAPSVWYALHLEVQDTLQIIGPTFPGVPGFPIGRTDKIAWGVTAAAVDVQDLFIMDVDSSGRYSYNGSLMEFSNITEVIKVKGSDPVNITIRLTHDGMPVVTDFLYDSFGGPPLALKWPTIDPNVNDTTMDAYIFMALQANDWNSFYEALRYYVGPPLSFVFASTDGDIGYIVPGKIPERKATYTGFWPVPGNGSYSWADYIPYDKLPRALNPPRGYIASANNMITPIGYEQDGCVLWGGFDVSYRAQRITDLIMAKQTNFDVNYMKTIQLDTWSYQFQSLQPVLLALPAILLSEEAAEWKDKLLAWDGFEAVEAKEPSVFNAWVLELQRLDQNETGQTQWGDFTTSWLHLVNALLGQEEDPGCNGNCTLFAANALETALDKLGSSIPEWGDAVHQAVFEHYVMSEAPDFVNCMFERSVAAPGDCNTVNAGCYNDDESMQMFAGASYRQIIPLTDEMEAESLYIPPLGQSGDPFSIHFDDLLKPWSEGDYLEMSLVQYEIESTQHLVPK